MRSRKIALLVLVISLCSCSVNESVVVLKSADLPFGGDICKIAVVPFSNQTEYKQAATLFTRIFVSELIDKGSYLVAQEGDVRKIMAQMRVLPGQALTSEQMRSLADRLGVQILIYGSVLEMRDKLHRQSRTLDPAVAVVMRIMEASSGRTIWTTYNRSEGNNYRIIMHFGVVGSIAALVKKVSAEILNAWKKKGFKECTE